MRAFRDDVRRDAYRVDWWTSAPQESADVADRYDSLGIGLTVASLVALAARVGTTDIATFDERHFRAIVPLAAGDAYQLLPLDVTR